MCKECKLYKNFEELPQNLKDKFNSKMKGGKLVESKNAYVDFINKLNENEDVLIGEYYTNSKATTIKINKCGHITNMSAANYKNGGGCGICRGFQVVKGVNDIATTHPHLTIHFLNMDDAYTHTAQSSKKVKVKCIDCGPIKDMSICNLTNRGFSCPLCGDGISYPEKFMMALFNQLKIQYVTQFTYDKCKHKYDFLVYGETGKIIVETHGKQHYTESGRGRSLQEEHENDMLKYDLAVLNGHEYNKDYIILDARNSTLEWMKHIIMSSQLPILLDFNELDIDWHKITEQVATNLVKQICEYFKNNSVTTSEIGTIFGLHKATVIRYLKTGASLGWCDYNAKDEMIKCGSKNGGKNRKKVKGVHKKTGEIVIFDSISEAAKKLGKKHHSSIQACCSGKGQSAYGYIWSYID